MKGKPKMDWNSMIAAFDAKQNLLHSLNAYQKAVNTAAIVSITDRGGKILYVNDLFCEISKYNRKELLGKNHRIVNSGFHPPEFFKGLWKVIVSGSVWHGEIKNKAKDGSYYWVDTTISPIFNDNGDVVQYLSIRTLITERKDLEQEKERLLEDLTGKYNDMMQFNYIVSHNIRAPIAKIISLIDLLKDECVNHDDNAQILIKYLIDSALSLDEVINDLTNILSVSRAENQNIELVNLAGIINSVQDNLETQIRESGTSLQIYIDEDAMNFYSIKSYVNSIIFNLVSNAIKYSKRDLHPSIIIQAKKIDGRLMLIVTDYGIGIDLGKAGTDLFGLYKRFNFSKEGRGLGLYMTKTQVEALGGTIDVSSHPGVGTTFTISLPVKNND
ncbi:sensor histidine kinase [Mucilaginibacter gotjawali]|uniref:histidine kinase n=3 Tax=Mucilaginibacter gotjawali TaxID=1550579 RepID=A0A0X8X3J1_9SPHI|nr:HAMP domain-containing sensor histidine kinase [Mucilaginibacter gotjawali]MBB3056349.1 PAS domain S-box-containing protein [Mucilaginibacter gotjawali]BAU55054.1 Blue-light-activated protein [Mucilaginibacter gotjawali]